MFNIPLRLTVLQEAIRSWWDSVKQAYKESAEEQALLGEEAPDELDSLQGWR